MSTITFDEDKQVYRDEDKNTASLAFFGSHEKARAALESLLFCTKCIDCYNCTSCHQCYQCQDCKACDNCKDCKKCVGCDKCKQCTLAKFCGPRENQDNFDGLIIPTIPNIHQTILATVTAPKNKLNMKSWHLCETTHCRAGWAIHLAGEAGYKLEQHVGPEMAGLLIYNHSNPELPITFKQFYGSNDFGLSDMRDMAEKEKNFVQS